MTKTTQCTIQVLNTAYDIKCPEGEEGNLRLAAQKLQEQLLKKKKEFKKLDDYQALLLAALHISHELISCQHQQKEQHQQLAQFIQALERKISLAVTEAD